MTNAKTEILNRIRHALADRPPPVTTPRDYRRALPPDTNVAELFAHHAADYHATIHRTTPTGLAATITAVAAGRRLVTPPGIPPHWTTGIDTIPDQPPLTNTQLDTAHGVLTSCAAAIAQTGTIILDASPSQGRRVITLLPDLHLCVVHTHQIVDTITQALTHLNPKHPLTWISGPSATSDIELNRIEGVHGPRNLHILLVA